MLPHFQNLPRLNCASSYWPLASRRLRLQVASGQQLNESRTDSRPCCQNKSHHLPPPATTRSPPPTSSSELQSPCLHKSHRERQPRTSEFHPVWYRSSHSAASPRWKTTRFVSDWQDRWQTIFPHAIQRRVCFPRSTEKKTSATFSNSRKTLAFPIARRMHKTIPNPTWRSTLFRLLPPPIRSPTTPCC